MHFFTNENNNNMWLEINLTNNTNGVYFTVPTNRQNPFLRIHEDRQDRQQNFV